jgi:chitodextrinase
MIQTTSRVMRFNATAYNISAISWRSILIGYREYNKKHSKWAFVDTKNTQTLFTVDGLQGETEYEFKVCAVDDEGNDGPFSFYN